MPMVATSAIRSRPVMGSPAEVPGEALPPDTTYERPAER